MAFTVQLGGFLQILKSQTQGENLGVGQSYKEFQIHGRIISINLMSVEFITLHIARAISYTFSSQNTQKTYLILAAAILDLLFQKREKFQANIKTLTLALFAFKQPRIQCP